MCTAGVRLNMGTHDAPGHSDRCTKPWKLLPAYFDHLPEKRRRVMLEQTFKDPESIRADRIE